MGCSKTLLSFPQHWLIQIYGILRYKLKNSKENFNYQSLYKLLIMCTSISRFSLLMQVPSSRNQTCTSPAIVTDCWTEKNRVKREWNNQI